MNWQMSLLGPLERRDLDALTAASRIRVLNWNIQNPSLERSRHQLDWIASQQYQIVILTEARASAGCEHLREGLQSIGYQVFWKPAAADYSVMLATMYPSSCAGLHAQVLPERLVGANCMTPFGSLLVVGAYVPSRGSIQRRNVDKRAFQSDVRRLLVERWPDRSPALTIVAGDLNVIERDHVPPYDIFGEWEYEFYDSFAHSGLLDAFRFCNGGARAHSWFGRGGNGYRFDHMFVSRDLAGLVVECSYGELAGLSDHAPMSLTLGH